MPGEAAKRALAGTRFAGIRWIDETGSTNADLLVAARAGAAAGTVLVAEHQTAGRGRADRSWHAPPGSSLLVSVLLRPPASTASLAALTVGVATVDAIASVTGVRTRLKWPNDVVWPGNGDRDDRKLAGVLAEADWSEPARPAVVVGLGLNVNWPRELPDELRSIAVALNHVVGHDVDRETLLVAILRHLDEWDGCGDLLDAARERSASIGTRVRVELASRSIEGDAIGLGDDGHLVVRTDDGDVHDITAGDVVHLRPA